MTKTKSIDLDEKYSDFGNLAYAESFSLQSFKDTLDDQIDTKTEHKWKSGSTTWVSLQDKIIDEITSSTRSKEYKSKLKEMFTDYVSKLNVRE